MLRGLCCPLFIWYMFRMWLRKEFECLLGKDNTGSVWEPVMLSGLQVEGAHDVKQGLVLASRKLISIAWVSVSC